MAAHIEGLLVALKQWKQATNKLSKKGQPPSVRQKKMVKARKRVLTHLAIEPVEADLDELIQDALAPDSTSTQDIRKTLVKHPQPLLTLELKTVHPMAVKQKDLSKLVYLFLKTPDEAKPVASHQDVQKMFEQLSLIIPEVHEATKALSRKQKKRRRRDLTLGTLYTALGIGLLAGNSQLDLITTDVSYVANASYILGGNALLSATKNLVGELDDR